MSGRRTILDYLIYVCAFGVIGIGGLGAYDSILAPGEPTEQGVATPGVLSALPPPFPDRQYVTVLVMGADDRGDRGRSDTIMVLFLNPRSAQAAMLSIPRDLKVAIPGHRSEDKINHSYNSGGVPLTKQTVEDLLDLEIDYYAKADFNGFIGIVDMLGGVDLEVPDVEGRGRGMNYDDNADGLHIHLKPGPQHLDGEQAIGFVRYRKGDSDFSRMERQQQFLKAMVDQKVKLKNVHNLVRAAGNILECIDTDLGLREAMDLARVLRNISSDNVLSASIPADGRLEHGVWYAVTSERKVRGTLGEVYTHLDSLPAQPCPIEVLNGSGRAGAAAAAGGALSAKGFEVTDTGNADTFNHEHTLIEYPKEQENTARMVKRILACGELVPQEGMQSEGGPARLRVVIGADYETAASNAAD